MQGLDLDLSGLTAQDCQAIKDFTRYLQMKAGDSREARNSARGLRMKLLLILDTCPFCGKSTTGVRRAGEDHQSYPLGAVVINGCGCQIGCGHQ